LESHNSNSVNADIFYGDLPLDFHKQRYTILISDSFAQDVDVDLFIPKPSYLEIDGIAFADDMRGKVFSNAKNSMLQDLLLNTLVECSLIPISMAEISNWNNRADAFIQTIELDDSLINNAETTNVDTIITYKDKIVKK
jgi:hypothetical protein